MSVNINHQSDQITTTSNILRNSNTGGLVVPVGDNVGQKPSVTGNNGLIRYNSTTNRLEAVINGAYTNLALSSETTGAVAKTGDSMTGQLSMYAATAGAPAITFTGDLTTGVFRPSAGNIGFSNVGSETMRLDSSGRLVVGSIVSPSSQTYITVNKSQNTLTYVDIINTNTGNAAGVDLRLITSDTAGSGAASVVDIIKYKNGQFFINNSEPGSSAIIGFGVGPGPNNERLRIDNSGNVGIGTGFVGVLPSSKLHVIGNGEFWNEAAVSTRVDSVYYGTTGYPLFRVKRFRGAIGAQAAVVNNDVLGAFTFVGHDGSTNLTGAEISGQVGDTVSTGVLPTDIVFKTALTSSGLVERMRLTKQTGLYINCTGNPLAGIVSAARFNIDADNLPSDGASADGINLRVSSANNGINIRKPTSPSNSQAISFWVNTTNVGSVQVSNSATTYATSSDYRLKENLKDLTFADAKERVNNLKVYRGNFKSSPGQTQDFCLAHEVQEVVPEAVVHRKDEVKVFQNVVLDKNDEIVAYDIEEKYYNNNQLQYPTGVKWVEQFEVPVYQQVDYSKMVPLLIAATKTAIAEITALKAEIAALKAKSNFLT